jgi:hypothetical protein
MSGSAVAADHGGQNKSHGDHDVSVHVKHLGEHEKANFKVPLTWTLQQIWDEAYNKLEISRQDRDVFQAPQEKDNPRDLTPYLALTLEAAQAQGICKRDFEIAAGTGGA